MPDQLTFLLTVWLAFFGAAIGSFLNVVIYRLPLGKSLVSPPSHCPKCSHRIRWFDNVPVFGWLMLGGKCRDCKEPISVRYPLVEFFCGAVFGVLGFLTLEQGGDQDVSNLLCLSGIESVLIVSLLTIGLIEFDGQPIPWSLLVPSIVLTPFALCCALDASAPSEIFYRISGNLLLGLFFGVASSWFTHRTNLDRTFWTATLILIGFYFGKFVVPIVGVALLVLLVGRWILNRPIRCSHLVLAFVTFAVVALAPVHRSLAFCTPP